MGEDLSTKAFVYEFGGEGKRGVRGVKNIKKK